MDTATDSSPPVRQSYLLTVVMSILAFIAATFSAWAGTNLQTLKESAIRQEGANSIVQQRITSIESRLADLSADRYMVKDATRDRDELRAAITAATLRIEAMETVHAPRRR